MGACHASTVSKESKQREKGTMDSKGGVGSC